MLIKMVCSCCGDTLGHMECPDKMPTDNNVIRRIKFRSDIFNFYCHDCTRLPIPEGTLEFKDDSQFLQSS